MASLYSVQPAGPPVRQRHDVSRCTVGTWDVACASAAGATYVGHARRVTHSVLRGTENFVVVLLLNNRYLQMPDHQHWLGIGSAAGCKHWPKYRT